MKVGCLVVAKAPVPGEVKTRIARQIGDIAAAELAAAAILDTLNAIEQFAPAVAAISRCAATYSNQLAVTRSRNGSRSWSVSQQRGETFAHRLVAAHIDAAARLGPGAIVQVGMDTPQLTAMDLAVLAATCSRGASQRVWDMQTTAAGGAWGPPAVHQVWGLSRSRNVDRSDRDR